MKDQELLKSYIPMVHFIAAFGGPHYEVVLHDLRDIEHSIIAIENGHISGRKIGDGIIDFAYKKFVEDTEEEFIVNQSSRPTQDHRILRLSAYRIRSDISHELIGLLCVTADITDLIRIRKIIDAELYMEGGVYKEADSSNEGVALPLADILEGTFRYAMNEHGCITVDNMSKEEKMAVITTLKEQNLFEIKGAVSLIARKLKLSEPSIYRYLREIKYMKLMK